MPFSTRKLPVAEDDLLEAALWYEEQSPGAGLSREFVEEADAIVESLAMRALHHRVRFEDVRRAPLQRFGFYGVYFVISADAVVVIAVFHDSRDPALIRRRRREVDPQL